MMTSRGLYPPVVVDVFRSLQAPGLRLTKAALLVGHFTRAFILVGANIPVDSVSFPFAFWANHPTRSSCFNNHASHHLQKQDRSIVIEVSHCKGEADEPAI
jgi:hypothetical protein